MAQSIKSTLSHSMSMPVSFERNSVTDSQTLLDDELDYTAVLQAYEINNGDKVKTQLNYKPYVHYAEGVIHHVQLMIDEAITADLAALKPVLIPEVRERPVTVLVMDEDDEDAIASKKYLASVTIQRVVRGW